MKTCKFDEETITRLIEEDKELQDDLKRIDPEADISRIKKLAQLNALPLHIAVQLQAIWMRLRKENSTRLKRYVELTASCK